VAEDDGLAGAPVVVVDVGAVFDFEYAHGIFLLGVVRQNLRFRSGGFRCRRNFGLVI
jgi:hypothetical protein